MNLPQPLVGFIESVGTVLLHFVWQGALLALIYAAGRPLLTRMSSRYRFGLSMLALMALCPLVTFAFLSGGSAGSMSVAAATLPAIQAGVEAVAGEAAQHWQIKAALPWLVGAWLIGVLMLATRSLLQWRRLARMVRSATAPPAEWTRRLAVLRERFNLRGPVRLLCSTRAVTPMLIGWLRPVVLLPASMLSGFAPAQIEMIIAHELGHICRWDYLANLFQVVLETVLFYHPAVHWISHEVRNARESCCDELVLQLAEGNPLAYARTLADLEEMRHEEALLTPALGATGGVLLARIRHIVGVIDTNERMPRTQSWPIVLIAVAVALLAWRPHSSPITNPDHFAASIAQMPQAALAVVSGNAALAPPSISQTAPPAVPVVPSRSDVVHESIAPPPSIRVDTPRVAVATIDRVAPALDVSAPTKIAAAALDLVQPDTSTLDATDLAASPAPLRIVSPVYPQRAKLSRVEGNVELEYGIAADGTVSDVKVVKSNPSGVFDAAAISALHDWRFAAPSAARRYVRNFAFTLQSNGTDDHCVQTTGTMICRRPGDFIPNRTLVNERH